MEAGTQDNRVPHQPVRLLVACRRNDGAQAIASRIAAAAHGAISGAFAPLRAVAREAALLQPDVALLEHTKHGDEALWLAMERLASVSPHTRIVLVCDAYSNVALVESVRRGVDGCVLASASADHWAQAVQAVHRGEPWFRRAALVRALRAQAAPAATPAPARADDEHSTLTAREREILELVGSGLSNKGIGRRLEISDQTVKTHLHNIYRKLHRSGRYNILLAARPARPAEVAQPRAA